MRLVNGRKYAATAVIARTKHPSVAGKIITKLAGVGSPAVCRFKFTESLRKV